MSITAAFLRTNGYKLRFNDREAYDYLIDLYERSDFRFVRLEAWLRSHTFKAD